MGGATAAEVGGAPRRGSCPLGIDFRRLKIKSNASELESRTEELDSGPLETDSSPSELNPTRRNQIPTPPNRVSAPRFRIERPRKASCLPLEAPCQISRLGFRAKPTVFQTEIRRVLRRDPACFRVKPVLERCGTTVAFLRHPGPRRKGRRDSAKWSGSFAAGLRSQSSTSSWERGYGEGLPA